MALSNSHEHIPIRAHTQTKPTAPFGWSRKKHAADSKKQPRCTWIFGEIFLLFFCNEDKTNLVGRGKGVVVLGAEVSGPRVEHLDHLSAAVDLLRFRRHIDDYVA